MRSLTLAEARERGDLITVTSYTVELDLDQGAEVFGSRCAVRFSCSGDQEDAESWADLKAVDIASITLNGAALDPGAVQQGRLPLRGLARENELVVEASMAYSHDGQGLHRATDPADGRDYVYGHLFLDAAPSVFVCFDQPDLKAPYDVSVTAPADWVVIGNGVARQTVPGRWQLATTRPLATYFVTVCAGPYVSVRAEHGGIPLGLHARASLQEPLERHADEMLEITRASFDYFHALFGIRYPFGEYHQVFVPEFNAGAMENPGCVTFRDQYLFRGAATRDELLSRANTIAHEMSHMWFGDIVTMAWWDDLWLNESFAEYMSHRCLVAATEYTEAWVDSSIVRKVWGYGAERSPSTHPVAGVPALDAQSALQNFDGISYAKGSAALRQLIAYVGDEAFVAGVRAYLTEKSYGNGTFTDFLSAIETASDRDLKGWAKGWLLTADRDTLAVDLKTADGAVTRARVLRETPDGHPADRPHAFDVAAFTDGQEVARVSLTIESAETPVSGLGGLVGKPMPKLVVPNASDLTWARVRLGQNTIDQLTEQLPLVGDEQARAVVWSSLVDGLHDATLDPRVFLDVFAAAWPSESNASILTRVSAYAEHRVVAWFLPRLARADALARLAAVGQQRMAAERAGTTAALAAARLVAGTSDDESMLAAWAAGRDLPQGLADDGDFRWIVVRNLADRGLIDEDGVETFRSRDDTLQGSLNALMCRAALPDPAVKAWAWDEITQKRGRSNYELVHLARGFWSAPTDDLLMPYVPRYFTDVPAMAQWVGEDAMARVALVAFPKVFTDQTAERSGAALTRDDLSPAVRRQMIDADAELREVLASQLRFSLPS